MLKMLPPMSSELRKKFQPPVGLLKDTSGQIVNDSKEIKQKWKE